MTRKLPPDYALWEDVARTIKPLHKARPRRKAQPKPEPPVHAGKTAASAKATAKPPAVRHDPPQLTGLDRRSERRMMRGKVEIEARIDLHAQNRIARRRERFGKSNGIVGGLRFGDKGECRS